MENFPPVFLNNEREREREWQSLKGELFRLNGGGMRFNVV